MVRKPKAEQQRAAGRQAHSVHQHVMRCRTALAHVFLVTPLVGGTSPLAGSTTAVRISAARLRTVRGTLPCLTSGPARSASPALCDSIRRARRGVVHNARLCRPRHGLVASIGRIGAAGNGQQSNDRDPVLPSPHDGGRAYTRRPVFHHPEKPGTVERGSGDGIRWAFAVGFHPSRLGGTPVSGSDIGPLPLVSGAR